MNIFFTINKTSKATKSNISLQMFFFVAIIFFSANFAVSQSFNNEWIDYDRQYFRIPIAEDGLYRIQYSELLNAGVPVNVIDPRNIQIFHNGEEQYIYIKGEGSTGIFDPNGYIEFYGKRNRGELDVYFFDSPDNHINPDHSFYNDTSSFFITWNNSINNKRYATSSDSNFSDYQSSAQTNCYKKIRLNYTGGFYHGSSRAIFSSGTGYFDNSVITETTSRTKTISTPGVFNSNIPTKLSIAAVGVPARRIVSTVPHRLKMTYQGNTLIDEIYYGYEFIRKDLEISSMEIQSSISLTFSSNDTQQPNLSDRNAVSYIEVVYPHRWNFGGSGYYDFLLKPNSSSSVDYIEITNFNTDNDVYIYDITNNVRIIPELEGQNVKALVPNADVERELIIANHNSFNEVPGIHKISSDNKFTDYSSLILNADFLIITEQSIMDAAKQYANYRATTGFNAEVIDIEQLYHQFALGVRKHPASIRIFADYLYQEAPDLDRYLFLIGKSIHFNSFRNNSTHHSNCLVPSAGIPASDNLITAGLGDTKYEPLFYTGRLSARNENHVIGYLNKVMEFESQPPGEWMKQILHFGGGSGSVEQTTFQNYLNNYKTIIEGAHFGGNVSSFFKHTSEPIQITQSDSVKNLIENGVSLMTFFGHASATGFDQSIDNPENYNNRGKYYFTLANSCFSGDIHTTGSTSVSERWVLIPERGSIGFLASVGTGISTYLNIFSEVLYKNISYELYNHSIGKQLASTIKTLQTTFPTDPRIELTCHEFTLHGDPAIGINSHQLPDLIVNAQGVNFNPTEITTSIDSFDVYVEVKNIGKAVQDTFLIKAERTLPNGSSESFFEEVPGCYYKTKVSFRLPVNRQDGPGMNTLRLYVDPANEIEESDISNNELSIDFVVISGDIYPISPYNYAIIPDNNVTLKASSVNPFISSGEYIFQVDTADYFNSSGGNAIFEKSIISSGGIISAEIPFELEENTVYYWRVASKHSNPDSIVWKESSFIHIEDKEGWSQAHFHQFKENDFRFIDFNRDVRTFDYVTTPKQLHIFNTGTLNSSTFYLIRWTLDGVVGEGQGDYASSGVASAMMVAVIDPETLRAWPSNKEPYGHRNYPHSPSRNRPDYYYVFSSGSSSNPNISGLQAMNSLIESIPEGHFLIVYSWGNGVFEQWPENIYQTFESLGSVNIRNLTNTHPYILFTEVGKPNTTQEKMGTSQSDGINLYVDLETDFNYGNIKSLTIGPSTNWTSLHWDFISIDNTTDEITELSVFGIDNHGNKDLIIPDLQSNDLDVYALNNYVNAEQYPKLSLDFFTENGSTNVPAQLTKWQVVYDPVPETAISPDDGYYFCCDTLVEGENLKFAVSTYNISNFDMDSMKVRYWMIDNNNNTTELKTKTLREHPAGDILIDTIVLSTIGLRGLNSIWKQYNPINPETNTYFQNEQYHFNNIAFKHFYVKRDHTNPLLDVSFDGRHIMDGEMVSARPEIRIRLTDENKYLSLNDTSLFRIYITNMQSGEQERVFFGIRNHPKEELHWHPAELPDNSCQIVYNPIFEEDGIYKLRVQATDASGNESGKNDYVISFEVSNQSSITHLLNYPNPFSTSTRFVFELTGHEIPDNMRIEIFTVSGRLVKVIYKDELGPIRIGRNITDYAWDGRDMYGDRLATGVYFYRVHATINGENIEHRSTDADKFFKNQIGKMYLVR